MILELCKGVHCVALDELHNELLESSFLSPESSFLSPSSLIFYFRFRGIIRILRSSFSLSSDVSGKSLSKYFDISKVADSWFDSDQKYNQFGGYFFQIIAQFSDVE